MSYASFGLIALALGAYYIYYFKFGGKERALKRFGLRPGENTMAVYHASYIPEDNMGKDLALGLVGMRRRGLSMTITFTDTGEILLGNQENKTEPRRYQAHEISVRQSPKKMSGRLAGPKGLEKIESIVLITPDAGQEHLALATSGVQALRDFAESGRAHEAAYGI